MENNLIRQKLLILGTGSFAPEVKVLAQETGKYEVEAFVENWKAENCEKTLAGLPIRWIDHIANLVPTHRVICALGTTHRDAFIRQAYELRFQFATIVHPTAHIPAESSIGEGSILGVGSVVAAYTAIGCHVQVNRGCLIGHHTAIADFCTISPGANIAGSVKIGEGTYVGMGAIVLDHITIGTRCVVGAGAVVTRDVPDRVQVTGIPAKITKENIDGL
jgi:acetyltransferase EpsM